MDRNQEIVRTSILGIIVNVILAGFKVMVGFLSGSIAIILDAVNNVSDAFLAIITIISTKLAAKNQIISIRMDMAELNTSVH